MSRRPLRPALLAAVLLAALAAQGCFSYRNLGLGEVPVVAAQRTPLVCLSRTGGGGAELAEGNGAAGPAVSFTGVALGFSPNLTDSHEVEGARVFIGQRCLERYRLCDNGLVLKDGDRRVVAFFVTGYQPPRDFPASTREILNELQKQQVLGTLRAIDLDAGAEAQLAALSKSRRNAAALRLAVVLAGAAAAGAGQARGPNVKAVQAGVDIMKLAGDIPIPGDEAALAEKHPRLLPVFLATAMLKLNGKVCIGRVGASAASAK